MLRIVKHGTKIDFVSTFKVAFPISVLAMVLCVYGLFSHMNYGVDFRGGAEIQLKFSQGIELEALRKSLLDGGFSGVSAQGLGEEGQNEYLIKVGANDEQLNQVTERVQTLLQEKFSSQGMEVRKVDIVGPKAGAKLRTSGFLAMAWALLAIMVYVGLRFDFKYAPGAIFALFHDALIIVGFFAFTGTEFTLQTVAAILAIIGYSINDTVVIFDRVREHESLYKDRPFTAHINNAMNETLSRTILTSALTLMVALSMYFFGGLAIKDFFMAISIGAVAGAYSTVFVATPITIWIDKLLSAKAST